MKREVENISVTIKRPSHKNCFLKKFLITLVTMKTNGRKEKEKLLSCPGEKGIGRAECGDRSEVMQSREEDAKARKRNIGVNKK